MEGFLKEIDQCHGLENFSTGGGMGRYSMDKIEIDALSWLPKLKCVSVQLVPEHLQIFGLAQPQNDDIILSSFLTNTCFEELEFLNLEKNEALNIEKLNCLANRSCPKLNALKLDLCKNLNLNDEVLEKLIGNCPNLEITSLLKVQVDDLSDELIYKLLAKPIILNSISEETFCAKIHQEQHSIKWTSSRSKPPQSTKNDQGECNWFRGRWWPVQYHLKMPFFGTIWILPKSRLVSNFCAIITGPPQAVKMAPKFKTSLDFGRIQILPKNGIFKNCELK